MATQSSARKKTTQKTEPENNEPENSVETLEPETELEEHTPADKEAIRKRIAELKGEAAKNNTMEKARELLSQLPKTKTASERGVTPLDYAMKVMASQSSDNDLLLQIARVRRALKKQGYGLAEVDTTITMLEEAYQP